MVVCGRSAIEGDQVRVATWPFGALHIRQLSLVSFHIRQLLLVSFHVSRMVPSPDVLALLKPGLKPGRLYGLRAVAEESMTLNTTRPGWRAGL